jgi:hypothetical protein
MLPMQRLESGVLRVHLYLGIHADNLDAEVARL